MPAALQRPAPISLAGRLSLTKSEAAQVAGCSPRMLEIEHKAGRLRVSKVGSKRIWLIRVADLQAWLDSRVDDPASGETQDDE